jgi:DNA-directed RNA polymerase specialized sigma24 family protein
VYNATDAELIELRDYARKSARGIDDLESAMMDRLLKCLRTYNGTGTFLGYAKRSMKWARLDAAQKYVDRQAREATLSPEAICLAEEARTSTRPGTHRPLNTVRPLWSSDHIELGQKVETAIDALPREQRLAVLATLAPGAAFDQRNRHLRDGLTQLRKWFGTDQ